MIVGPFGEIGSSSPLSSWWHPRALFFPLGLTWSCARRMISCVRHSTRCPLDSCGWRLTRHVSKLKPSLQNATLRLDYSGILRGLLVNAKSFEQLTVITIMSSPNFTHANGRPNKLPLKLHSIDSKLRSAEGLRCLIFHLKPEHTNEQQQNWRRKAFSKLLHIILPFDISYNSPNAGEGHLSMQMANTWYDSKRDRSTRGCSARPMVVVSTASYLTVIVVIHTV